MSKYKVSVIIPIYNVEKYIEDTIKSIINQTIGFENIELILINDGSPYNEEKICLKYKNKYNNIKYIKKENGGVSSARNEGIKIATGEYINFIDSDDKFEKDAFRKGCEMLDNHPEIDVVGFRQKFFEAAHGYHVTDFRFDAGDRIIDITKEHELLQLSAAASLIRREAIKDITFDEKLKYSEDAKFMTEVLFKRKKMKYGAIASSNYLYRKRKTRNSSIQTQTLNKNWYTLTLKEVYVFVMELSKKMFGKAIPYAEYFVMYHLQSRINKSFDANMTKDEKEENNNIIKSLLDEIDDYIILEQKIMSLYDKMQALNIKYNNKTNEYYQIKDNKLLFKNIEVCDISDIYTNLYEIQDNNNEFIVKIELPENILNIANVQIKTNNRNLNYDIKEYKIEQFENFIEYSPIMKSLEFRILKDETNKIKVLINNEKIIICGTLEYKIITKSTLRYKLFNYYVYITRNNLVITKNILLKICRYIIHTIHMFIKHPKQQELIILSTLSSIKFKNTKVAYLDNDGVVKKYLEKNNIKNVYKVSDNKQDSNLSKKSLKYKLILLNSKDIYVSVEEKNKSDIKFPFGKSTKMYVNKMKANYHFIDQKGNLK